MGAGLIDHRCPGAGNLHPELERARREHLPAFTDFLDLPILFVIVALGAMRPDTWSRSW